jgi:hypothetical protein
MLILECPLITTITITITIMTMIPITSRHKQRIRPTSHLSGIQTETEME